MYLYLGPCVKYPNTSTFLLRILSFSSTSSSCSCSSSICCSSSSYSACSSFSETGGLEVSGLEGPAIDDPGRGDAEGTVGGDREFCRKFIFSLFRSVTCTIFLRRKYSYLNLLYKLDFIKLETGRVVITLKTQKTNKKK